MILIYFFNKCTISIFHPRQLNFSNTSTFGDQLWTVGCFIFSLIIFCVMLFSSFFVNSFMIYGSFLSMYGTMLLSAKFLVEPMHDLWQIIFISIYGNMIFLPRLFYQCTPIFFLQKLLCCYGILNAFTVLIIIVTNHMIHQLIADHRPINW